MPTVADLARTLDVDPAILARAEATLIGSPIARHLGIRLVTLTPATALLALPYAASNVTLGQVVHGGVIATLADVAAVCAAIGGANSEALSGAATSSMTISYLSVANGADLEAEAQVLRATKRQAVCRVTIREPGVETIAEALVTIALFS